jgi:hypothetical protein
MIRIAVLLAFALLLHFGVLAGQWRWDDPQILLHLHQYSILEDLSRPEVWQQFSPANLTPWLLFSFEVDLLLFGLRPGLFYLHQLLALCAAALAMYLCMLHWMRREFAFYGVLLFLVGAPVFLILEQLMTRHYIEGLVFCLLAIYFFTLHLRQRRSSYLLLSVGLYVLALTAKEIYAPLLFLLAFLPEGDIRRRLQALIPFALVAILYTLWRGFMLGTLSGGYVESTEYFSLAYLSEIIRSFSHFPELLFGRFWPVPTLLYILLAGSYALLARSWLPICILVALLILLPLAPLVRSPGILSPDRYLLLFWLALCFSVAFFADQLQMLFSGMDRVAPIVAIYLATPLLLAISWYHANETQRTVATIAAEFDAQGKFIWTSDDSTAFIPSGHILSSFWFVRGLIDFKRRLGVGSSSPVPIVDAIYLEQNTGALFSYTTNCDCMSDISESIPARIAAHAAGLDDQAPLSLRYAYQEGIFSWQFGPYQTGSYHVVSDVIPAPPSGRLRVTLAENAPFYLRYTSPEGRVSYSAVQHIQHNAPEANWDRE